MWAPRRAVLTLFAAPDRLSFTNATGAADDAVWCVIHLLAFVILIVAVSGHDQTA
jgi:hypothetical protein